MSDVALLAGAWIETKPTPSAVLTWVVALLAGAWIETSARAYQEQMVQVALLAGAWIETIIPSKKPISLRRRPPCGGVD